ncbi:MAG: DNA topoisomerase I [Candidatus Micrarchaeota archaeon]
MQLIICEKPSVAEKLADAISGGKASRKKANEITYYMVERDGKEIAVAPAVGHVYGLKQKTKGREYPVFDIEWVPSYKVNKDSGYTKGYLKNLEELGEEADEIVNASDFDLEGSLIGYNIIRYACGGKPAKRMKFSALTQDDLIEAYENMQELDVNNAKAGETRHMLDWFYGINMSRALMGAIRKSGAYRVMSIGRVQGPALEMLAKRERDIKEFKPEPYWQIYAYCRKVEFLHERNRFEKKEDADVAFKNSRYDGVVESVTKREFKQPPNPPFDLTSLQVEAHKVFGFSPAQTLEIAQTLYENTFISYPRTASQKLPEKLNLPKIIGALAKNEKYAQLANKLIEEKRFKPHEGSKEDPAHPAIFPTGVAGKLGEREMKVYDLIVRRFLACFAEPATRESMNVKLLLGTEHYGATGVHTVNEGWIAFYKDYLRLEEVTLPEFKEAEKVRVDKLEMKEKKTEPPKRFTEASIIQQLEKRSLGTKATRANIIETLYKRGYVINKSIEVTPYGLSVCGTLEKYCPEILDEELTRKFEEEMEGIQEGKIDMNAVLEEGKQALVVLLAKFKEKESAIGVELNSGLKTTEMQKNTPGKCPKCGQNLRIIFMRGGRRFVGCTGYPKCRNTYPLPGMGMITTTKKVCEKCKTPIIKVKMSKRRAFEMCLFPGCETKKNWGKKWEKKEAKPEKKGAISKIRGKWEDIKRLVLKP